ncbi:MAG TPA: dTDP-4-dehydrorhamnose reductase [Fibrobacteraceae bacterium]|nr:dTDP-4-dehydrorhamnose reductase [Fibrobacteraceae bacterium]
MRIWITGASGMLAQDFIPLALQAGHVCFATDCEVDICDPIAVRSRLDQHPVDFVLNCAAYTAVDKAESEEPKAFQVNALGPENLARETAARNIGFLHISTDYVLNGQPPEPLNENAPLNPSSVYGRTKAQGELRVAALNPKHWIVRTAWLYGIHGNNFVKTMLRLMAERDGLRVVNDQWGAPTWTVDLCQALLHILASGQHPGIYHFTDEGRITWYTFALAIQKHAKEMGLLQRIIPVDAVSSSEYASPASRPTWSVLDKTLIHKTFAVPVPDWEDSLQSYLRLEADARH